MPAFYAGCRLCREKIPVNLVPTTPGEKYDSQVIACNCGNVWVELDGHVARVCEKHTGASVIIKEDIAVSLTGSVRPVVNSMNSTNSPTPQTQQSPTKKGDKK